MVRQKGGEGMTNPIDPGRPNVVTGGRGTRLSLRFLGLGYLALLLVIPLLVVVQQAFFPDGFSNPSFGEVFDTLTTPEAQHAFYLTMVMVAVAVPLNAIFGVACAIVLVRHKFRGKAFLNGLIDLPFAISPVVIGLALLIVYGINSDFLDSIFPGGLGSWLLEAGVQVIFHPVGMALATTFVSLPFVVREVEPVLREIGDDQEQAARTLGANNWQTFWRITLPAIRWGVTYGIVLATARALGEFGAVSVVATKTAGEQETAPLLVRRLYDTFDNSGAYAAALVLAVIALLVLGAMNLIRRRDKSTGSPFSIGTENPETEKAPA
jgi:sulfate/thiosulfate transport system permease protein